MANTKQNELIYDKQVLKQHFPNWNKFPDELQQELKYWEANGLDLSLLDPLSQDVPGEIEVLFNKARLIRWGLELKNTIDFSIVNKTPEQGQIFDELTPTQLYYLILMQVYSNETQHKLPDLTTIGDPNLLEEKLIIKVYNLSTFNADALFDKGLSKPVLDEALVAMTNDIPELANFVNKNTTLEDAKELNKQLQKARPVKDGYTFEDLLSPKQGVPTCVPSDISVFKFKSQQDLDQEKMKNEIQERLKKEAEKERQKQKQKQKQSKQNKSNKNDVNSEKTTQTAEDNSFGISDFSQNLATSETTDFENSSVIDYQNVANSNQIIQNESSRESLDSIKRGMTRINYRDGLTREELANEFDRLIEHVLLVKEAALNSNNKW